VTYLVLSIVLRQLLNWLGRGLFAGRMPHRPGEPRGWRLLVAWRGARTITTER
jgi:polar amino acid transport system permease protein